MAPPHPVTGSWLPTTNQSLKQMCPSILKEEYLSPARNHKVTFVETLRVDLRQIHK
jgi:hypothetical protein